jgi:translation initiation factor 2B subunit (eIF-2B alpha/beta/delta family)
MFNQLNTYRFNRICKNIKDIKIQGATSVARAAIKAYYLVPKEESRKKLLSLRPTEPMLAHVLNLVDKWSMNKILAHFEQAQDSINKLVFNLIRQDAVIFTHCHSTNVVKALIYAKLHGKHFSVFNTETRPLFQGRKTSSELAKAGIKVTTFVDSAASIALDQCDLVLFGADALLWNSVINKVGSGMFSEIAHEKKIPLYIVADSWKYSPKNVQMEERDFREVWGSKKVHIKNPAFEPIKAKNIYGVVTELGIMSYPSFIDLVRNRKVE